MGKRRSQDPPGGGDAKPNVPKMKPSPAGDQEAAADGGCAATAAAQSGTTAGKLTPEGRVPHGSAGTRTPRSAEDAAERGGDAGGGTGATLPEAAPEPDSPQGAGGDGVMATGERDGSAGEELGAQSPTHRGTGSGGDGPDCSHAAPAPPEEPDPQGEEGADRSELGDHSQEPAPAPVACAEESGAVSTGVAGEQPQATGTSEAVKDAAEPRCSPADAGIAAEDLGVGPPLAQPKVEGDLAEPESAGTTGTGSQPRSGNASPAPDPAVVVGGDPAGGSGAGGLVQEHGAEPARGAEPALSLDAPPPAGSGAAIAESLPAGTATPEPVPTGITHPPATDPPQDEPRAAAAAGEQPDRCRVAEGNHLELPPQQQPPGCAPRAEEETGPAQPRDEGTEASRPPARWDDATDVVRGLIRELSSLNRLAMSAHRGLEVLRRPKPRRNRRPAPRDTVRRWKET